jgi:RNA polymerase sigma factor (sigma-70 family)
MLEPSELRRGEARHEDVFLARYRHLRAWALRLSGGNAEAAEDLVHDAFVQFTLARPDLARVGNLDGYLYRMLRNLQISQKRRARRRHEDAPAVVEYDSAEFALRAATDPRDVVRVQDDLRQVCHYACLRKETSKAGSVLILRFMHGYYPGEIARILRSSREAVEERLRAARVEARQFLEDPSRLRFIGRAAAHNVRPPATGFVQTHEELLADLRRRVFDSRRGACLTERALAELYGDAATRRPDCATLAHLVSCPRCIEEVNSLNGLPPLSERHPTDSLGVEPRPGVRGGDDDGEAGGSGGDVTAGDSDTTSSGGDAPRGSEDRTRGGDDNTTRGGDENMKRGGGGEDGAGGGTHGASAEESRRCRRRARDVFEHRPRELCVAVNGRLLAAQKVASVLSEQKLNVGPREEVSFVEVFSEQDVRLLYLDPAASHAEADGSRAVSLRLSDGRTLEARLSRAVDVAADADSAQTLQVVYRDPLMAAEPSAQPEGFEADAARIESARIESAFGDEGRRDNARSHAGDGRRDDARRRASEWPRSLAAAWSWLRRVLDLLARPFSALRPAAVTAALAVLVVAALLFTRLYAPTVSAAELLRRAAAAEESAAAPGVVLHRTVFVEEARSEGRRSVVTRRRVETWQSGATGIRLRRLYDEQGRLAACELSKSDGTSTLFRRGSPPSDAGAATPAELLDAGEVWRIEPSARSFDALGAGGEGLKVEDKLGAYLLSRESSVASRESSAAGRESSATSRESSIKTHESSAAAHGSSVAGGESSVAGREAAVAGGLVGSSLWLNKSDLHAYRMTLVVRRGGETVEYRFVEGGFERRRAEEVPPVVYQLEPELLDVTRGTKEEGGGQSEGVATARGADEARGASNGAHATAVASAELEVEVAYLLNQIKANLGEQVSVGRTTGGALRVEALVESEARKEAILRALGPVLDNPAVEVEVSTVAEALAKRGQAQAGSVTEREVTVGAGRIPADAELRAHFAARLADAERVEAEIKQFAARAMSHSRQALLHASALKRLAEQFTPAQARALPADARAKWLSMVREHAGAYRREVAALRAQLTEVFDDGGAGAGDESVGDDAAAQAAARLLQLSYAQDGAVRSAFTISEGAGSSSALKSQQFWRRLASAERLASEIEKAYER